MPKRLLAVACFLLFLLGALATSLIPLAGTLAAPATPTVRYVAPAGSCGGVAPCYAHPQAAIDAASAGDEIRAAAGVYAGVTSRGGTTQAVYLDKSISLRGGYKLADWTFDPANNPTTLDAQGQGRVLTISGDIAPVIEGLRLTQGAAANGGGVYVQVAAATLRDNEVYNNTADSWGAGIYLENSRATLTGNRIHSNTTGKNGWGGGVALLNSPATLSDNSITGNSAHAGGGVELANYNPGSGALLRGNTISDNTAFDYVVGSTTFDGAGGGIYIGGREADTLVGNTISENTAKRGAGLNIDNAPAVIADNLIEQNQAGVHGGGLYVQGNQPTIRNNRVLMNSAASLGGGLHLWAAATVRDNLLQGNVAGYGGGLYGWYGQSAGTLDGNRFLANTATAQGGGAYLYRDSGAVYRNNVFVANQAQQGGGLYLSGATSQFVHSTIAGNSSADGRGVVIDKYPGAPDQIASRVAFTNTIFAGQTVAIFATAGNTLSVDGVLWHDTVTPVLAPGAYTTQQHEFTGDPRFWPDGYHLRPGASAALDRGSPTDNTRDVDGQLRPMGGGWDLGADEQMPSVSVGPGIGGIANISALLGPASITVTVPPGAFTFPVDLQLAPFPPPPVQITDLITDGLSIIGLPFRVDPLVNGLPLPTLTVSNPLTVTLDYSGLPPGGLVTDIGMLEVVQNPGIGGLGDLFRLLGPGCGPASNPGGSLFSVPVCQIGGLPPLAPLVTSGTEKATLAAEPGYESVYFLFVGKRQYPVYLPLVLR
jgi:parallel beta-helix repeat protein